MTRKHYRFFAGFCKAYIPYGELRDEAIDQFVKFAGADNVRFDALQFAKAAGRSEVRAEE